jgi:stage II sporulation protein D
MISCEGLPYRGGFMFISGNNGAVGVVNILRTEEYLYGVLSLEIGRGSPIEALKAQAVAARSFAAANMSKHADEGFNLCSSTHCQLYWGYSAEYEETNRAVDETAQRKLYYGGQTVGGYYFKNSGGHTRDADEAWGGIGAGYLLGAADEYSPDYTWNFAISAAAFRKALESAGHVTGDIISVALNRNPGSGFVSEALINGAENTASLKGETMRTVLGANNIKSMNFTLGNSASNAGNTESVVARDADPEVIHLAGAYDMERLPAKVYIISGGGEASRIDSSSLYMRGAPGSETSDSANADAEIFMPGEILNFSGKGYGHGVGMPQDSAVEMALQGFSYTDILNKYYTGAEIK